jgi:hypothetical protein
MVDGSHGRRVFGALGVGLRLGIWIDTRFIRVSKAFGFGHVFCFEYLVQ